MARHRPASDARRLHCPLRILKTRVESPAMHDDSASFRTAEEALYAAFVRYQGSHVVGCPHCVSFEDGAALRRTPLRQLGSELDRYLFKAMTTWGTKDDFKHFVPRLIELYAVSSNAWLLCDKLAYANWRSWPEPERQAIEKYLEILWRQSFDPEDPPLPGYTLLETMVTLELDLAPYDPRKKLNLWRTNTSRESAQHLADFVLDHGPELFWPNSSTGRPTLWRRRPDVGDDVCRWLLEPATREALETSFLTHGNNNVARAFDWLEMVGKMGW